VASGDGLLHISGGDIVSLYKKLSDQQFALSANDAELSKESVRLIYQVSVLVCLYLWTNKDVFNLKTGTLDISAIVPQNKSALREYNKVSAFRRELQHHLLPSVEGTQAPIDEILDELNAYIEENGACLLMGIR